MWDIYEVIEGDCKGKYVVQSIMGIYLSDDEGSVLFFDTPRQAQDHIDEVANRLRALIDELGQK